VAYTECREGTHARTDGITVQLRDADLPVITYTIPSKRTSFPQISRGEGRLFPAHLMYGQAHKMQSISVDILQNNVTVATR
jgi:hypothetical protein